MPRKKQETIVDDGVFITDQLAPNNLMQFIWGVYTINGAVQKVTPYLGETERSAHKTIYFDGWDGLGASAVLRAIAEHPPTSQWRNKFDRIIHIDCSRWRSRRALQRTIADEMKLPHSVMAAFDRQDMEDDFSGVDEDSRAEVPDVTREIYQAIKDLSCLVIFHNGNDSMVDLSHFGFPQFNWFSPYTVLWTFSGRLRIHPEIKEKVDNSHLCIYKNISWSFDGDTAQLILEEATEVIKHTQHKHYITPEIAAQCITYILWLHEMGGNTMEYNWATHASNYWVCDGIIRKDQFDDDDEAWDVSAALHKQIQRMEFSSSPVKFRGYEYTHDWMSVIDTSDSEEMAYIILPPELTSLFLANKKGLYIALPCEMFQQLETLHVLKLSWCRFSFCSPPFQCCLGLRFLGLDHCEDQEREEEDKQGRPIMKFFRSLWVLDISHTDWEFNQSQELVEQMTSNIREVRINKGRIWRSHLAWRQLQNLHKLQVIEPTSSWETGKKDEFADMAKLELLHLSGNSTVQVLPSLSSTTGLKTLILDGCVGLDHVGPEGLPPSLESFSLDATSNKLSKISLSGCAHLQSFLLCGELPGLEELNLSGTSVRRVDLSDKVVQVQGLKKVFLMGCKQLRAILWWQEERQLEVLRIGTLETEDILPYYPDSSSLCIQHKNYVVTGDARIIQSLLLEGDGTMITSNLYLDLHVPPTNCESKGISSRDEVIPKPYCYNGVLLQGVAIYDSEVKWPAPLDCHMDVGEGISLTDVESNKGTAAIRNLMLKCINSLHVHDNSGILDVTPPKLPSDGSNMYFVLKWCRVEMCPKLQAVFVSYHSQFRYHFRYLETIWASDLPVAICIWTEAIIYDPSDSFEALKSIHLHNCPRLKFVLPLMPGSTYLPSLETVHITGCSDLTQVFPWDNVDAPGQYRKAMEFPKLKHILLHHLASLQEICEAKMSAPMLESVKVRGCWALRRLPAVSSQNNSHHQPVVHCEKDWWEKLEWEGLHAAHHPSLYEPRYSSAYYKKRFLRGTVLR